jgi:uridine kinase
VATSSNSFSETFSHPDLVDKASALVLDLIEKGQQTPIVLVDGRSASGKSTFAAALQNRLFQLGESAPRVIHMDSLYNGWSGLQDGHDYLLRFILTNVRAGKRANWQEFDWAAGARTGPWREFEGGTALIVEGCGALSSATAEFAQLTIWLETDAAIRKQRWDAREPTSHEEFWPVWAAQEEEFYAREKSAEIADLIGIS